MKTIFFGCALTWLMACNDDEVSTGKSEVEFEITDAPVDDAEVRGVMVTIADVKVDGHSLEGFSRQTIDLTAYQNGATHFLGGMEMDARSYSNVVLVLDLDKDQQGNSPGCYVLDESGAKHKLQSTASGTLDIAIGQTWNAIANAKTNVVMDFDLRKSIRYSDDPGMKYEFVSGSYLNNAVRVVTKQTSGTIKGTFQNESGVNGEKVIVYAYKKGTFNAQTETQNTEGVQFRNAVSSAEVRSGLNGGAYVLAFLPAGEYELHFASYSKDSSTDRMSFDTMLESELTVNGSVMNVVNVEANSTITITSTIKGII